MMLVTQYRREWRVYNVITPSCEKKTAQSNGRDFSSILKGHISVKMSVKDRKNGLTAKRQQEDDIRLLFEFSGRKSIHASSSRTFQRSQSQSKAAKQCGNTIRMD